MPLNAERQYLPSNPMEKKIKVLIVCDWYEPGYKAGGPIQSCKNLVTALNNRYQFYILTSDRDLGDNQPYPGISVNQWVQGNNDATVWYSSPGFLTRKIFLLLIKEVNPEIVYFNSMFSQQYTIMPVWALVQSRFAGKMVLSPRGMLQAGAMRRKTWKKILFLKLFKLLGWNKRIIFHATDEQEKLDILSFFPEQRVVVADNIPGVNNLTIKNRLKNQGQLRAVFISRIHPKKNLHFILEVLQTFKNNGHLILDIYGEEDDRLYTAQCKSLATQLPPHIQVTFHGALPHSKVFEELLNHHLFLLPTLGENFGHAIYEAMSSGCPVLISNKTPWQNLSSYFAGFDLPLSDIAKFQSVLNRFMCMHQDEYDQWSAGTRKYANNFLQQADFDRKYEALFGS
jgi:glycosyltransferase involved in cell wall biosynthesis